MIQTRAQAKETLVSKSKVKCSTSHTSIARKEGGAKLVPKLLKLWAIGVTSSLSLTPWAKVESKSIPVRLISWLTTPTGKPTGTVPSALTE